MFWFVVTSEPSENGHKPDDEPKTPPLLAALTRAAQILHQHDLWQRYSPLVESHKESLAPEVLQYVQAGSQLNTGLLDTAQAVAAEVQVRDEWCAVHDTNELTDISKSSEHCTVDD